MAFSKLSRKLELPQTHRNGTGPSMSPNLTELPTTILETFIPGYSLISGFILDVFGFDVSILVSAAVIIFATVHVGTYIWQRVYSWFRQYLMSNIYIDDGDDLFDSILSWIGEQQMAKKSRSIKAVTRYSQISNEDEADENAALDEHGIFHYGKYAARQPPRYEPYFGVHRFWHKGSLYIFDRSRREVQSNPWTGRGSDEELIKLSCIGRSTNPLRLLLSDIKARSLQKQESLTNIRRPAPKDMSRRSGAWDRVSSRPSRPMETVSLDKEQKARIVADINEYLHPASPRWYASRGIPWRRGYLFHGPPGTGKSSLSFALAGLFGLDIYVISLLEPTLTEGDLNRLFSNLPRRCIVLLEDIDTAGLLRDEKSDKDEDTSRTASDDDAQLTAKDLAKALKTASRKGGKTDDAKQGISLSGLLNAIDGVASHEGRVLVMTTNHPEKLDEALIRPGRVDLQVQFSLATHEQMRDIFVRMYSIEFDGTDASMRSLREHHDQGQRMQLKDHRTSSNSDIDDGLTDEPGATTAHTGEKTSSDRLVNGVLKVRPSNVASPLSAIAKINGVIKPNIAVSKSPTSPITPFLARTETEQLSPAQLRVMGDAFAAKLPEDTFSPAEVQGFLLIRKKEPRRALEEVDDWRTGMMKAKEKKSKVVAVQ
ncbi:P-loop containing nucleoside triphosphate hydrolase protein [Pseudovirgaria hyperparasitica]|uniref:P-loop containing nucleoside triphosphate hydrolase protein n=1 Tax=Pseudovirgaria hyperparasitica TaxID=470096 RepID=A0A6A6VXV2_9PEZI|nr:P-loop containing nucleoside triphosphate hydrolase protein [Pseudovirgaria hyperparasitica]KAF2754659.1 P-loop containing nucleoside triphosphate hydrolase protein [Pseudovirgaria hyperparasitica]